MKLTLDQILTDTELDYHAIGPRADGNGKDYFVILTYHGRTLTTPYMLGAAYTHGPMLKDVLYNLISDAQLGSLKWSDFVHEVGRQEDEDSWQSCREIKQKVVAVFDQRGFTVLLQAVHEGKLS
jgi:hypothetical protein